jgi:hypothetical protein
MPEEITVPWDLASTTMVLVLGGVTQVCAGPQSWEGGQPPQVLPQPSLPQVFPVQSGLQLVGVPESAPPPEDELVDAPLLEDAPLLDELWPCPPVPPLPPADVPAPIPPVPGCLAVDEHAPMPANAASAAVPTMIGFCIRIFCFIRC